MDDHNMTETQEHQITGDLARITALLEVNTQSTRRMETRLFGEDSDPESGIIANHSRRIRALEDDKIRQYAVIGVAVLIWQIVQAKVLKVFGLAG